MPPDGSVTIGLEHLKAGDVDAASPLWHAYFARLVSVARGRLRSSPKAIADEEDVAVQYGDKAWVSLGGKFDVPQTGDALSFDFGYEWFWKGKDVFQGTRDRDYTYLSDDSFIYKETVEVGATLSSVKHYLRSGGLPPGEFGLTIFIPTRGRNVPVASYGVASLAMYF